MQHARAGFSLVELAVVLVILAVLLGVGLTAGQSAVQNADRLTALERLSTIKLALDAYAARNGYLPCPAPPQAVGSDASFGLESRSGVAGVGCVAVPGHIISSGTVWFGTLPTRNLGLSDSFMYDPWGNKLTYAVSGNHVGTAGATNGWNSYYANNGSLEIRAGTLASSRITTTTSTGAPGASATYAVISHGRNGRGAYPYNGSSIALACTGPTGNEIDVQNCDRSNAIFYDTTFNEGSQPTTQFDDYIVWGSNAMMRNPPAVLPNACPTISGNPTCESWCAPCEASNSSTPPVTPTRICAKFITAPLPTCTARCIWPTADRPCP